MRRPDYDRRVAVTGLGIISPVGTDIPTAWDNLTAGVSGLERITRWDPTISPCHAAGEVNDFDPKEWMNFKAVRRTDKNDNDHMKKESTNHATELPGTPVCFRISADRSASHC